MSTVRQIVEEESAREWLRRHAKADINGWKQVKSHGDFAWDFEKGGRYFRLSRRGGTWFSLSLGPSLLSGWIDYGSAWKSETVADAQQKAAKMADKYFQRKRRA